MSRMQGSTHRGGHRRAPFLELLLTSVLLAGLPLANGLCEFPASWSGQWFQTGKPEPVFVNASVLNNRTCYENRDDMYIVREPSDINCYRCMIINERHENVIQFREGGWCDALAPLEDMCGSISSDESLTSMFRLDSKPIACPFTGPPFTFSYSRGYGECTNPVSHAESCTDESKLLLKYQACPDVVGTESSTEELQCMATWKDGRNKYLVGTVKSVGRSIMASNEDTFRCFLYEKNSHHQGKVVYDLAQSGDATCNGLTSVPEGSRTIRLTKVDKEHNRCKYPSWVTQHHDWHSLDGSKSYHFTTRNATLKVTAQDNNDDSFHEEKIVCHNLEKLYPNDNMQGHIVKLVAHITSGCDSGYVCMIFHKRDGHIIELQESDQKAIVPEEACAFSDPSTMPYTTLITTTLHQRRCPYPGRYTIVYMLSEMSSSTSRRQRRSMKPPRTAERRTWPDDREDDDCRNVEIGCSSTGQNEMTIDSSCEREKDVYLCHGSWEENGTWYTIASHRNSKLTTGPGRAYCFSMRMSDVPSKTQGRGGGGSGDHHEQELQLSSPSLTCQRDTAVQWTYRLASQGVCEDLTKAASSTASSSSLSRVSLVLSAGAAVLCTLLSR